MNTWSGLPFLRDKRTQRVWIGIVITWACVRAYAINKFFGQHHINPWGYLFVDLASSVPYALYSSRAVVNFLDKSWFLLRRNALLTALFFYIPDLYIFIFARTVPVSLYIGFVISIVIFSILALISLKNDVIKANR